MKSRLTSCCRFAVVGCLALAVGRLLAGDPPPSRPVSQFAPADDLVAQVKLTMAGFAPLVASEEAYQTDAARLKRDAHTLAALALVLGLHDSDHSLKAAAPALLTAARQLAQANDFATAKTAVEAV